MTTKRPQINRTKSGDLRVWNIINPPSEPIMYPVKDVEHAMRLIDALADSQLLVREIGSNAFGLEEYRDGEWQEWENEEGEQISDLRDNQSYEPTT